MSATADPVKLMKQEVGKAAAALVKSGSIVGLGTGSTTAYTIQFLGDRIKSGELKDIVGIPTSFQSEVLAKEYGVPLTTLDAVDHIDIAIDGADEVDPQKNLIKGGGAALTREKIIAAASEEFVCIADESKLVPYLGTFPLPIAVIPMVPSHVARQLVKLGGDPVYREGVITDNGNVILDVHNLKIDEPRKLEAAINQIVGVVANGLFAERAADLLLLSTHDGVKTLSAKG